MSAPLRDMTKEREKTIQSCVNPIWAPPSPLRAERASSRASSAPSKRKEAVATNEAKEKFE